MSIKKVKRVKGSRLIYIYIWLIEKVVRVFKPNHRALWRKKERIVYTIILLYVHFSPDAALKELRLLHYSSKICNVRWYRFQHQKSTNRLLSRSLATNWCPCPGFAKEVVELLLKRMPSVIPPPHQDFQGKIPFPPTPPPSPHILLTLEFLFAWKNVSCILSFFNRLQERSCK